MKIRLFSFLLCLFFLPFTGSAQQPDTTGAGIFFQNVMSQINPKHVNWVRTTAKTVNEKNVTENEVKNMASQYAVLNSLNGADIEALAFLVLMQAAKSAQEDLKAIMAKVKSINEEKQAMREAINQLQNEKLAISRIQIDSFKLLLLTRPAVQKTNTMTVVQPVRVAKPDTVKTGKVMMTTKKVSRTEIDNVKDQIKNKLDSLSEMGEMESLRLQMAMDRMSKMMSTLSNLLKKISDTQNSIVQNLK